MNYSPDDFLTLLDEVEKQGGAMLNERCEPTVYTLKQPDESGKLKLTKISTSGCSQDARFGIPYTPPKAKGDLGILAACAVDDNIGDWPRFRKVVREARRRREEGE